ncbi:MAG: type IV secretory system conjugative DNA transfer family protein, partial [Deltaproteobacteria bacterium]|nr:type IV secretory system conjugative DNA transfer family protein [Deltaproteobacteria bacterium]
RYSELPRTESLWWTAELLLAIPSHCAVFLAVVVAVRRAKQLGGKSDLHGSAHWAGREDLAASGLLNNHAGVYVGGWQDGTTVRYLRHDGPQHVLAFAPSRSGKGVGLVIPTLLSWPHSVLVHDIKGENWALTAGWRQRELGSVCLKFDPTCADDSAARYNPLREIRDYPFDVRDAQNLADIIIDPEGTAQRDHWDRTARDLITGVILHQLYAGTEKSLTGCFHLLTNPLTSVENTLTTMMTAVHDPHGLHKLKDPVTKRAVKTHPVVAGAARAVLNKSENERSSVISSAVSFLDLYRDPLIARNTSQCDFLIRDLMHQERPVSLYLTTPPSDLARTKPLLRMLLTQIGTRLTERMDVANGAMTAAYRHRLLLMLDEFPALGRLPFFQTALGYLAGYGIKAYLIVQDIAQLHQAYGRDSAILSNCHVRVAYTPNTFDTAKMMSDMLGMMTVSKETRTYTGNRLNPVLMHVMASEQESQRPLLTPDEVLRLPEEQAIVFVAGQPPIQGTKIRYYLDHTFQQRATVLPPAASDRFPSRPDPWSPPPAPAPSAAGSSSAGLALPALPPARPILLLPAPNDAAAGAHDPGSDLLPDTSEEEPDLM